MQNIGSNSNHHGRLVGYTKLVRETSPWNYQGFKGSIYTDIYVGLKDINCNNSGYLNNAVADGNKKDHNTQSTGTGPVRWSQAVSHHVFKSNGQQYSETINLIPCP